MDLTLEADIARRLRAPFATKTLVGSIRPDDETTSRLLNEAAAEIERLRAELRAIASCQSVHPGDVVDLAKRALKQTEQ